MNEVAELRRGLALRALMIAVATGLLAYDRWSAGSYGWAAAWLLPALVWGGVWLWERKI